MSIRHYFDQELDELRNQILLMGSRVREELVLALEALATLDPEKAQAVFVADQVVNQMRFQVEEQCFTLIATQQPAARDLRTIIAAINVIVDLERMGDQAKGIAKVIPTLRKNPAQERPFELKQMGEIVERMLDDALRAYATGDKELAEDVAGRDHLVDALYGKVFTKVLQQMAVASTAERAEPVYDILRVARELERFGDLATNVAERIVYLVTGAHLNMNE